MGNLLQEADPLQGTTTRPLVLHTQVCIWRVNLKKGRGSSQPQIPCDTPQILILASSKVTDLSIFIKNGFDTEGCSSVTLRPSSSHTRPLKDCKEQDKFSEANVWLYRGSAESSRAQPAYRSVRTRML